MRDLKKKSSDRKYDSRKDSKRSDSYDSEDSCYYDKKKSTAKYRSKDYHDDKCSDYYYDKDKKRSRRSYSKGKKHSKSCSKKKHSLKRPNKWCGTCVGKDCPHRLNGKLTNKWQCRSGSCSSDDPKGVESSVTVINIAPACCDQGACTPPDGECIGDGCWKCADGKCKPADNSKKVCTTFDKNGHALRPGKQ